jgi:cation:H+ antiporter
VFGYIFNSTVTSFIGLLLILAYIGYIGITAHEYEKQIIRSSPKRGRFTKLDAGLLLAGVAMLLGGAEATLQFSVQLFTKLGVSEIVVGSVILALGTSLPELVTTLTAVIKKEGKIAVGNVLGSNVFNILIVFGTSALIAPVHISQFIYEIIFLGIISAAFMIVVKTGKKNIISRNEGAFLCILYAIYTGTILLIVK